MAEQIGEFLVPCERKKSSAAARRVVFLLSLVLNLLLSLYIYSASTALAGIRETAQLRTDWTSKAARLADEVSRIGCSGHGKAFIDTGSCECHSCFTGDDCSHKVPNCDANSDGGDPLFLEPFWDVNAEAGSVMVAPSYRMSYNTDGDGNKLQHLERRIRQLHAFVGNAVTEGRYIVLGTGSIQLVNAAVASLAPEGSSAAVVVSRVPYYGFYEMQTEFFENKNYKWGGDAEQAAVHRRNEGKNITYIEIVGAPSNPDSSMQRAIVEGALAIYDRAYYWPHYAPITEAVDDEVTLFTMSKITGHAGSRLGWAIVKDPQVYKRMVSYIGITIMSVSHDAQLRAWKLLEAVLEGYAAKAPAAAAAGACPEAFARDQHIFHFADAVMHRRWQTVKQVFDRSSQQFALQNVIPEPQVCSFFKTTRTLYPAYLWVKCKTHSNCYQAFKEAGILGRSGFGANDSFVRFTLLRGNDDFDNFVDRLTVFLNNNK